MVFVLPILRHINPSRGSLYDTPNMLADWRPDDIIALTKSAVLVSSDDLALALKRLFSLLISVPNPGLCRRLLETVSLDLWALASWRDMSPQFDDRFRTPARTLLQLFLKVTASTGKTMSLVENLLYNGEIADDGLQWRFESDSNGEITILRGNNERDFPINWSDADHKSDTLVSLLFSTCSKDEVVSIFMDLLRRWLSTVNPQGSQGISLKAEESESGTPVSKALELIVLQKMMEKAPETLIGQYGQLLDLVSQVLNTKNQVSQPDDVIAVALSLLNLAVTAPTFQKSHINPDVLEIIETSLGEIGRQERPEVSQTARNLSLLLQYRDEVDEPRGPTSAPTNKQIEDRRTYNLAMSYITENDSPPPVRSEGLNLISVLIEASSSILDIPAILVLLSALLKEDESFINLRAIKMFTQLATKHPKTVIREILEHYVDAKELSTTDARLRFGEALLQVIERLGETFTGDAAQQISEALLSIASRRGHRPKTEAKQAREARLQKTKNKQAEDAWGGDVPDVGNEVTKEEQARIEIISQIVSGWESKRGSEDVRMRTSALSIFASAMDTNIAGIGPTLVSSAIDLCVNILVLEPEMEKGILRRSAIIGILGFIKALNDARESGRNLAFGLTDQSREDIARTLKYVAGTDNDGLVQQHANDALESLENWQMAYLMPQNRLQEPTLGALAGLQVYPRPPLPQLGSARPRIEEIE
jgi:hypothetical protein